MSGLWVGGNLRKIGCQTNMCLERLDCVLKICYPFLNLTINMKREGEGERLYDPIHEKENLHFCSLFDGPCIQGLIMNRVVRRYSTM